MLARQITLQNKIPTASILRRPVLVARFGDGSPPKASSLRELRLWSIIWWAVSG